MLLSIVLVLAAAVLACMLIDAMQVAAPWNRVCKIIVAVVAFIIALAVAGVIHPHL